MEKNKEKMMNIANVVYWISVIGKWIIFIGVIAIVAVGLAFPIFISQVGEVTDTSIQIGERTINYELLEDSMKIEDTKIDIDVDGFVATREVRNIFRDNGTFGRIVFVESILAMAIVFLVLAYMILNQIANLFKNIYDGGTPFTKGNVSILRQIGKYMIIITILPAILGAVIKLGFNIDYLLQFRGVDLIYILVIFALAYVFEYGYQLQEDVDGIL
jgi:hypothetical protein